jgi:hypothetical protein
VSRRISVLTAALGGVLALGLTAGPAMADTPTPQPTRTADFGGVPTPRPVPVQRSCDNVRISTFAPTAGPTDEVSPTDEASPLGRVHPSDNPTVNPRVRCRPESFNIALVLAGNTVITNYAKFNGPVAGTGSDDLNVSTNTSDRFSLPGPGQRVNLLHTGIPFPSVNLRTCTAAVIQLGLWRFNGGPLFSVFRNAIGNGTFRLVGLWHFPNIRGVCSLSLIRGNPLLQNRINPDFTVIGVRGTGVAAR